MVGEKITQNLEPTIFDWNIRSNLLVLAGIAVFCTSCATNMVTQNSLAAETSIPYMLNQTTTLTPTQTQEQQHDLTASATPLPELTFLQNLLPNGITVSIDDMAQLIYSVNGVKLPLDRSINYPSRVVDENSSIRIMPMGEQLPFSGEIVMFGDGVENPEDSINRAWIRAVTYMGSLLDKMVLSQQTPLNNDILSLGGRAFIENVMKMFIHKGSNVITINGCVVGDPKDCLVIPPHLDENLLGNLSVEQIKDIMLQQNNRSISTGKITDGASAELISAFCPDCGLTAENITMGTQGAGRTVPITFSDGSNGFSIGINTAATEGMLPEGTDLSGDELTELTASHEFVHEISVILSLLGLEENLNNEKYKILDLSQQELWDRVYGYVISLNIGLTDESNRDEAEQRLTQYMIDNYLNELLPLDITISALSELIN